MKSTITISFFLVHVLLIGGVHAQSNIEIFSDDFSPPSGVWQSLNLSSTSIGSWGDISARSLAECDVDNVRFRNALQGSKTMYSAGFGFHCDSNYTPNWPHDQISHPLRPADTHTKLRLDFQEAITQQDGLFTHEGMVLRFDLMIPSIDTDRDEFTVLVDNEKVNLYRFFPKDDVVLPNPITTSTKELHDEYVLLGEYSFDYPSDIYYKIFVEIDDPDNTQYIDFEYKSSDRTGGFEGPYIDNVSITALDAVRYHEVAIGSDDHGGPFNIRAQLPGGPTVNIHDFQLTNIRHGDNITLTADDLPDDNLYFSHWLVNGETSKNSTLILSINEPTTIIPVYKPRIEIVDHNIEETSYPRGHERTFLVQLENSISDAEVVIRIGQSENMLTHTVTGWYRGDIVMPTTTGSYTVTLTVNKPGHAENRITKNIQITNPHEGHDYAVTSLRLDEYNVLPGAVVRATATIENAGTVPVGDVPVLFRLIDEDGAVRDEREETVNLQPGDNTILSKNLYTPVNEEGTFTVEVRTMLSTDNNTSNDFRRNTLIVGEQPAFTSYYQHGNYVVYQTETKTILGYVFDLLRVWQTPDAMELDVDGETKMCYEDQPCFFDSQNLMVVLRTRLGTPSQGNVEVWLDIYTSTSGLNITPTRLALDAGSSGDFTLVNTGHSREPRPRIIGDNQHIADWLSIENFASGNYDLRVNVPSNAETTRKGFWVQLGSYVEYLEVDINKPHHIVKGQKSFESSIEANIGSVITFEGEFENIGGYHEYQTPVEFRVAGPDDYSFNTTRNYDFPRNESNAFRFNWNTSSLEEGVYHIEIQAILTNSPFDDRTFEANVSLVVPAPDKPVLVHPPNNKISVPQETYLEWETDVWADEFEVVIATDSEFADTLKHVTVDTTYLPVSGLSYSQVYYWRTRAINHRANSEWSETYQFTTAMQTPGSVILSYPNDNNSSEALSPEFVWSAAERAEAYEAQLSTNDTFSQILLDSLISDTTFVLPFELQEDTRYYWRIRGINSGGSGVWTDPWMFTTRILTNTMPDEVPAELTLSQNYPNPFNPTTVINFALPVDSHVRLTVYNLLGQQVATMLDENKGAGWHQITFDASHLSSGLYIYRLETDTKSRTKQMMLIK